MASWGDINATLNRLVSEGVIVSFRTNHINRTEGLGLHIIATTPVADRHSGDYDPQRVEAIRQRIAGDIGRLARGATITLTGKLP
jgi:hypothetical protein